MVEFRHVKPGDAMRIPAATFNTMVDAARDFASHHRMGIAPEPEGGEADGVILLKNTSDHDLTRYEALALDAPIIDPADNESAFQSRIAMTGVDPDADHRGRFAVAIEPIAQGKIGLARIAGPMIAKVDIQTAGESYADIVAGHYNLVSGVGGSARILWAPDSDTGIQLAIVHLLPIPQPDWFKISSSTRDGTNYRWTYTAKRQVKTTAGWNGWEDSAADTADYTLLNTAEASNDSTGTYGNGIAQANIDAANNAGNGGGTFEVKPIPVNTIVWAQPLSLADGTLEWWIIGMPNGVDGACG